MPAHIIRHDITLLNADAIVCCTNKQLRPDGGVSQAVHRAAGPQLAAACAALTPLVAGEVKSTKAFALSCRYVLHTVGPRWRGGLAHEKETLASCYINALHLAKELRCRSIAFPLISSGAFGFPKEQALHTAMTAISDFLTKNDMTVYLVVYGRRSVAACEKMYAGLEQYIDDHYVAAHPSRRNALREMCCAPAPCAPSCAAPSLEDMLHQMDEGFSPAVLRLIKEKGLTNAQCYKRANIDKKLFSKIKNDPYYKPRKPTALALAIALRLSLSETQSLLQKAGLALSHSEKFDVIVEFFITQGNYNIFDINEALFQYDQPLLGGALA